MANSIAQTRLASITYNIASSNYIMPATVEGKCTDASVHCAMVRQRASGSTTFGCMTYTGMLYTSRFMPRRYPTYDFG